tara:strand:+ start:216 stop:1433 length:1218 start_codon:yes stop_codon:yes gene_type:complete
MNKISLDIEKIRKDFPIFQNNPKLIFLDNSSTTQKPQKVIDAVSYYYENYNSNIHRGIYALAEKATEAYELVRNKVSNFIDSKERNAIVFTRGTTESINLVANSWGNTLKPDDEILISEMEHHSNIIPWQLLSKRTGAKLSFIPIKNDGTIDLADFNSHITNKTRLVSIIHQSNVFGTINPIKKIIEIAHKKGALVLVDGAQSIPHQKVSVSDLDCDFFVFSGHKMLGPTGVGVLYGKPELLESMEPFMGGGEMIREVNKDMSTWNDIPWKFEAGTPNVAQVIGLGAAIDYIEKLTIEKISAYENELLIYAQSKLKEIRGITIFGDVENKGAIISFNIKNIHPHDIAHILDADGIAIRAGHHCAQLAMKHLNVSATNRVSFYIYNSFSEIDSLITSLNKAINLFK